jgi:hypothetical protein
MGTHVCPFVCPAGWAFAEGVGSGCDSGGVGAAPAIVAGGGCGVPLSALGATGGGGGGRG